MCLPWSHLLILPQPVLCPFLKANCCHPGQQPQCIPSLALGRAVTNTPSLHRYKHQCGNVMSHWPIQRPSRRHCGGWMCDSVDFQNQGQRQKHTRTHMYTRTRHHPVFISRLPSDISQSGDRPQKGEGEGIRTASTRGRGIEVKFV